MGYTCVPHMYPIWGTWGYIQALYPILGYILQSTNENAVLQKSFTSQSKLHYVHHAGLKIFQEGSHFCTSHVPQLRYLRYIQTLYLILRYIIQSTNENAVLQIYFILQSISTTCYTYFSYQSFLRSFFLPHLAQIEILFHPSPIYLTESNGFKA